eukprot:2711142-Rhodomonas_salina.8
MSDTDLAKRAGIDRVHEISEDVERIFADNYTNGRYSLPRYAFAMRAMLLHDTRYCHRIGCYAISVTKIGYAATRCPVLR